MAEYLGNGIYRIGTAEKIWSVKKNQLSNAVLPVPGAPQTTSTYGWLRGTALPEPADHGCYVVEFLSDKEVRVLAYIDWYCRAFTVTEASVQPPARQEDLYFTLNPENDEGSIYIRTKGGDSIAVANLSKRGSGKTSKYTMTCPGYNFGDPCKDMHYFDMMTRAYLAFIYRTEVLGAALPLTPTNIIRMLNDNPLDATLKSIMSYAETATLDPALEPVPTVLLLSQWLEEAGVDELLNHPAAAANLNLARTVFYAGLYYIRVQDEDAPKPPLATKWAIEGALNRFQHLHRTIPLDANPTMSQCVEDDKAFFSSFAAQVPELESPVDFPKGIPNGQWQTRLRISVGIENLVAPFRLETRFRYDHDSGEVLFDILTPGAALFEKEALRQPRTQTTSASSASEDTQHLIALQEAQMYAMHAGLYYAAVAFQASPSIERVRVITRPLSDSIDYAPDETGETIPAQPWIDVAFTREEFNGSQAWMNERAGNPILAYSTAQDGSTCEAVPTFNGIDPYPNYWEQCVTLQEFNAPTLEETQLFWNAATREQMAIEYNAEHRIEAQYVAKAIKDCTTTTEAVSIIRSIQENAQETLDGRPSAEPFMRLMEALAQGILEPNDSEAVIACFQGDDPCRDLYQRAQDLEKSGDIPEAIKLLTAAVEVAEASGLSTDNETTVYRMFESYWSRLIFNLQSSGQIERMDDLCKTDGRTVQLAPDYLYYTLLDLINHLEESFEGIEDAIRYGKAAVALAPTAGVAYRMLGRSYMLVGELENAIETLQQGLRIMQSSDDIALTYYQLGYVFWRSGQPTKGALCYAKSIMTSQIMAESSSNELNELQKETGIDLPDADEVDNLLKEADIVIAPVPEMNDVVFNGLVAAMDEGLIPAARSLLAVARRNYSRDDALTGVAISLFA